MLQAGRLDVIIGYETVMDYLFTTTGFSGRFIREPYRPPEQPRSHLALCRKSAHMDLVPAFNALLEKMVSSGEVERIISRFLERTRKSAK